MKTETRRNLLPVVLVVLLGLTLTGVTTWVSRQAEDQRMQTGLERRIENHIRALEMGIAARFHDVEILRSLFAVAETVTPEEFGVFIDSIGIRWDGLSTLAWIPWQAGAESKIQLGRCAPAVACQDAFISALSSSSELRLALTKARAEGKTVVSASVDLPWDDGRKSTLVVVPVFRHDKKIWHRQIKGFAIGVFVIAELVEQTLREQTLPSGLDLYFYEEAGDRTRQLLYYHPSRTRVEPRQPQSPAELPDSRDLIRHFSVIDNNWLILIQPEAGTLSALRTFEPWIVLGTGLFITLVLAFYISANLQRTLRVEAEVEERTKALSASNILVNEAKEQAEQANQAKTRFLAAASHELRQPLQALNLFVNVLSVRSLDKKSHDIVEHIGESTSALENLLNALLDISKLDAGLVVPAIEDVSVEDLFARLESQFEPLVAAKGLQLKMNPLPLVMRTDPTLTENIMRNLIANAVRYTSKGHIKVRCRKQQNNAVLTVEDTGPGIPEELRASVFQEFFRLDRDTRHSVGDKEGGGLGLGLAIVDRLANLLGHRVEIASAPKNGSVFIVEVPISKSAQATEIKAAPLQTRMSDGARILVIDDEPEVLMAIGEQLRSWGFSVCAAQSLEQALETMPDSQQELDLILADYRLGDGVTGNEAIFAIRNRLGREVPGLLISGDTAPDRLREAQSSGFQLLHKPIPPAKLLLTISQAIQTERTVT